jgi:hypothetical protein
MFLTVKKILMLYAFLTSYAIRNYNLYLIEYIFVSIFRFFIARFMNLNTYFVPSNAPRTIIIKENLITF